MKLSLIGMSNSGKTYWAKKLQEKGFCLFSCDDFIKKKLENELGKNGHSDINDVAEWMGQPYEVRYKKHAAVYLKFEREAMETIYGMIETNWGDREDIVVDTTGSVIYTDQQSMKLLKKKTTVVYLDTPQRVKKEMYSSYIEHPKPVIWGKSFIRKRSESEEDALARCYPSLLEYRIQEYKRWADIRLNYYLLRSQDFRIDNFLYVIQQWKERNRCIPFKL